MARAQATDEAVNLALTLPKLGVGCHVVLIDGEPVLPASQIPSLIDPRTGHFYPTLSAFLPRLFSGRIRAAEIEAEAGAQIELLQRRGLHLTHIDTHKHSHMFPAVLRSVLRAARARGLAAVRNPFEPAWALRATHGAPWLRLAQVCMLRALEPVFLRILAEEHFSTTDGTIAIAGTGILDAATIRMLLENLPDGLWELVTHPGYNDADLARVRTRLRASRETERQALAVLKEFPSTQLISFAGLTSSGLVFPASSSGAQASKP